MKNHEFIVDYGRCRPDGLKIPRAFSPTNSHLSVTTNADNTSIFNCLINNFRVSKKSLLPLPRWGSRSNFGNRRFSVSGESGLLTLHHDEAEGSGSHELTVEGDVDGVGADFLEAQTLEVHDEVAGKEGSAFGQSHLEVTHDGHALLVERSAIFIDNGNAELVVAGVLGGEAEAESQSAGGVNHGELAGEERIESALHAKLTLIIGSVVAKYSNLNVHGMYLDCVG